MKVKDMNSRTVLLAQLHGIGFHIGATVHDKLVSSISERTLVPVFDVVVINAANEVHTLARGTL